MQVLVSAFDRGGVSQLEVPGGQGTFVGFSHGGVFGRVNTDIPPHPLDGRQPHFTLPRRLVPLARLDDGPVDASGLES